MSLYRQSILLLLCFFSFAAAAQTPYSIHFSTVNGLPSSEVYHVMQDRQGFLWFSTNYGVSRFDGYKFKNYDAQNGLPDNTVFESYEDGKGRIWFISLSNQLSYYQNGVIHPYRFNHIIAKYQKTRNAIYSKNNFRVNPDESITYALNGFNILKIDSSGKAQLIKLPDEYDKTGYIFSAHIYEENGHIFVSGIVNMKNSRKDGYSGKFLLVYQDSKGLRHSVIQLNRFDLTKGKTFHHAQTQKDRLVFSFTEILFECDKNGRAHKERHMNQYITWISKESQNYLWVGLLSNGIQLFKNCDISKEPETTILPGLSVSSVNRDTEGGYWLTTLEDGVYYIPDINFSQYRFRSENGKKQINTLEAYQGKVIFAMRDSNLYTVSPESGIQKFLLTNRHSKVKLINDLLHDRSNGNLIICERENIIEKNGEDEVAIQHTQSSLFSGTGLVQSKCGYWVYSSKYLSKVENRKVVYNSIINDNYKSRFTSFYETKNGQLWAGGYDGLWKCEPTFQDGQMHLSFQSAGNLHPILRNRISDIQEMKEYGVLCVGTKGYGIIFLCGNKAYSFSTKQNLPSNNISKILTVSNTVWVGTNSGLSRITFRPGKYISYSVKNFTSSDGLVSNEILDLLLLDGKMYIGTIDGLSIYRLPASPEKANPPPIQIQGFSINNRDTTLTQTLSLPHDLNQIVIRFTGIAYKSMGNVKYRYRMIQDNERKDWVYSGENSVSFPYLEPGSYTFEVMAGTKEGVWSTQPAILRFEIRPPYWKTWWFKLLIILTSVVTITALFLYRLKVIQDKNKLMVKLNKYMLQALNRQMNPHFIFNALNTIQSLFVRNDKITSIHALSRFTALMRRILNNSRQEMITLREEIEVLQAYIELESYRFPDQFEHQIITDPDLPVELLKIPPLLIQPYVENAIIHGIRHRTTPGGKIEIRFCRDNEHLCCSITDNGIGREASGKLKENKPGHISLGTRISSQRIDLISQLSNMDILLSFTDLKQPDGTPGGTQVHIKLPCMF